MIFSRKFDVFDDSHGGEVYGNLQEYLPRVNYSTIEKLTATALMSFQSGCKKFDQVNHIGEKPKKKNL